MKFSLLFLRLHFISHIRLYELSWRPGPKSSLSIDFPTDAKIYAIKGNATNLSSSQLRPYPARLLCNRDIASQPLAGAWRRFECDTVLGNWYSENSHTLCATACDMQPTNIVPEIRDRFRTHAPKQKHIANHHCHAETEPDMSLSLSSSLGRSLRYRSLIKIHQILVSEITILFCARWFTCECARRLNAIAVAAMFFIFSLQIHFGPIRCLITPHQQIYI